MSILFFTSSPNVSSLLTEKQVRLLEEARMTRTVRLQDQIRQEMQSRLKDSKNGSPVLKLRLVDAKEASAVMSVSGLLSVWRPGEVWSSLKEGDRVRQVFLFLILFVTTHNNYILFTD